MKIRLLFSFLALILAIFSSGASVSAQTIDTCGCEASPLPEVVATVNGTQIRSASFRPETVMRVNELKQTVTDARQRELDVTINSILLSLEAKKRNTSTSRLIESEVVAKTPEPTEAEAKAFYDQRAAQIGRPFEDVKKQVIDFMRTEKQQKTALDFSQRLRAAYAVEKKVDAATPPVTPADRERVFAIVNGKPVKSADIEASLKALIFSVQKSVYNSRKQDLELKINDFLLEAEAAKRSISVSALLDAEVANKLFIVSDEDAKAFYDKNKERINGPYERLAPQIKSYLSDQNKTKAEAAFAEKLRAAANIKIFLSPPQPPVFDFALDGRPSEGPANARVTLVQFIDPGCAKCAEAHTQVGKIVSSQNGLVRWVVMFFPLSQFENSRKAVEAAEEAHRQGKFWEYLALLYANRNAHSVDQLKQYATAVGLNRARFDIALDSGAHGTVIDTDILAGQRVGVTALPEFYVNGIPVEDSSPEAVKAAIAKALGRK